MTSLIECPTEVIDSILEKVLLHDLIAASLASKKLHTSAKPLLYSRIDFPVDRNEPRPIIHLSRTLFSNPELATYVRSVRLRDREPAIQKLHTYLRDFEIPVPTAVMPTTKDEDGMPEFASFIAKSGLSYADVWTENVRKGNLNAVVALLLSRLPNLAQFRVGYAVVLPHKLVPQFASENQFLGKMFQSAVFDPSDHGLSRFQYLEDVAFPEPVELDYSRSLDFCDPLDLMALLGLPSMRSISGWCMNPTQLPFTWPSTPPDLTRLTSLSLSHVHIDFLAQILRRTRSLKCLRWQWKHLYFIEDPSNTTMVDLDRLVEALKLVRDTLEDLTVDALFDEPWIGRNLYQSQVRGSLQGLASFVNIKRFKAPFTLLLPTWEFNNIPERQVEDSLPPNVEFVTLTREPVGTRYRRHGESEIKRLRSWLDETAATRTPHLVEVCYYLTITSRDDLYDCSETWERIFEDSNVKCRIVKQEDEKLWDDV